MRLWTFFDDVCSTAGALDADSVDVEEIGYVSHGYAEHAGRTEANLVDVLLALDSLV